MSDRRPPDDVAQICRNGHMIVGSLSRFPGLGKAFCQECGAQTVDQCESCGWPIRGVCEDAWMAGTGPYRPPKHCERCGAPYPWTREPQPATANTAGGPDGSDERSDRSRDAHSGPDYSPEQAERVAAPAYESPVVFISYSWDNSHSEEHKRWVLEFSERLRHDGIATIIDQKDLVYGARIPEFMERSGRASRWVGVVCAERYKWLFDHREGGVGYEGHVITSAIVSNVGKNKFIPVLRGGDWSSAMPAALESVKGVDLREDSL